MQSILDTTRHPRLMDTTVVDHTYHDKYCMAETLTNTTNAATRSALQRLGVTTEIFTTCLQQWTTQQHQTVTMRFEASDSCSLLKETIVEVEDPTAKTTTTTTASTSAPL